MSLSHRSKEPGLSPEFSLQAGVVCYELTRYSGRQARRHLQPGLSGECLWKALFFMAVVSLLHVSLKTFWLGQIPKQEYT